MSQKLSQYAWRIISYGVPFSRRNFLTWLDRVGTKELNLLETMIEAAESIDENGQYELAAQFTTTGRPEIFEGDTK